MLERLRDYQLYVNLKKCQSNTKKIEFLRFIVSINEIQMESLFGRGRKRWRSHSGRRRNQLRVCQASERRRDSADSSWRNERTDNDSETSCREMRCWERVQRQSLQSVLRQSNITQNSSINEVKQRSDTTKTHSESMRDDALARRKSRASMNIKTQRDSR